MKRLVDLMDSAIEKLNITREKLHNHEVNLMAVNIIIDSSNEKSQIFVEIENDKGESIHIGEEVPDESGFRKIRITTGDIISHEQI